MKKNNRFNSSVKLVILIITLLFLSGIYAGTTPCKTAASAPLCGNTSPVQCASTDNAAGLCPGSQRCASGDGRYASVEKTDQSAYTGSSVEGDLCNEVEEICETVTTGNCVTQKVGSCQVDVSGKPLGVGVSGGISHDIFNYWEVAEGEPQLVSGGRFATPL